MSCCSLFQLSIVSCIMCTNNINTFLEKSIDRRQKLESKIGTSIVYSVVHISTIHGGYEYHIIIIMLDSYILFFFNSIVR